MYFYGIDAHSDNFKIERIGINKEKKTVMVNINTKELELFLKELKAEDFIVIEAGTNSFWFYDLVKNKVKDCYVVNPWKFADIKNSFIKTDKRDARKLAKHLKYSVIFGEEDEQLPTVYVPNKDVREIRSLFTTYKMYKKKIIMSKNRVHSLLKQQGISYKKSKQIFEVGVEWLSGKDLSESTIFQIQLLLDEIRFLEKHTEMIKEQILRKGVIFRKEIEKLISIKGISVFTAIAIMSDIVDIKRFSNAKKLCSYLGLAPKIDSSNKTTRIGCINRKSRKLTRTLLTQSVIHFYSSNEYYIDYTKRIKCRKSAGKVRIAIIRKIMTNIYRMLNDKKYFYGYDNNNYKKKLNEYSNYFKEIA